jgi:ribosomal protein S27AE
MVWFIAQEPDMIRSKKCFKCSAVKPLSEFYKHAEMADGHLNKCKECAKNDVHQHREKNLEKIRAYDRDRSKNKDRIAAAYEITKAWRQADSRRTAAHSAVARAIKSGKLTRNLCEQCGNQKSVGHHDDYDKPLEVRWLCQSCHVRLHRLK